MKKKKKNLSNKIVLVTGGAGRIGSELCKALVNNNFKVAILDTNNQKSLKVLNNIENKNSLFIKTDVTNSNSIDKAIIECKKKFGKIDAAVHCAYPIDNKSWGKKFEDLNEKDIMNNLFNQLGGALIFSQRIVNEFKKQGKGNLIHVSSILGVQAPKFEHYKDTKMVSPIEYSAIKSGIISITKYLAKYLKDDQIRVNCISPGGIRDKQPHKFLKKYKDSCLSKGMLDPGDIVGTLMFLLSDNSKYINGQNIIIDDGWSL